MTTQERRLLERFSLSLPAKIRPGGDERRVFSLSTANISAGGAFFKTGSPLPVGTEVMVELTLPAEIFRSIQPANHGLVKVSGIVLRHDPTGMAVKFHKNFQIRPVAAQA